MANTALSGGSTPYAIGDLNAIAGNINAASSNGAVSQFTQDHLVNGACPGVVWRYGDVITYGENVWGEPQTAAGQLLMAKFDSLYFNAGGVLEPGLSFTMTFQTAQAVLNYLLAAHTPSALNANLVDPTSSASGQFGGEVVALKLNVDFSDAGYTRGASGIPFGDLHLCGFTSPSGLNGLSVRKFLGHANSALGGNGAPLTISELNTTAIGLNESFEAGVVQQFAQDHLVNGACP